MYRSMRRYLIAGSLFCVVVVVAFSFLETYNTGYSYYGDARLIPFESYFVPSNEKRINLGYEFLITSDVCAESGGPYLIVMVMSVSNTTSQRDAIRNTWGSVARTGAWPGVQGHFNVKVVFLFGKDRDPARNAQLKKEADVKGDIVQASFRESYDNLTIKVLMGYKWIQSNCPDTRFVMKADDDTFINLHYIISRLNASSWSRHILGPLSYSEFVIREGRYEVSKSSYRPDLYPPHVKGNMYVMAKSVAMTILHTSQYMSYLRMEDAFITGVVAKIHDIRHVDIPEALYDRHIPASLCDLVTRVKIMSQQYTPQMLYAVWKEIKHGSKCSQLEIMLNYLTLKLK